MFGIWLKVLTTVTTIALLAVMLLQIVSLFSTPATIVTVPTGTPLPTVTPLIVDGAVPPPLPEVPLPTPTNTPEVPPTPEPAEQAVAAAAPIPPPPASSTPDLVAPLSIERLRSRRYGGDSDIVLLNGISQTESHTTYYFYYVSDGLRISGIAKYPSGTGPFPVIILVHGEEPVETYVSGKGTNEVADYYASQGYITFAPDLRNYGQSDTGSDDFFVGYAVDVLNLIAMVPRFQGAHGGKIGLWGHSLGGTIAMLAAVTRPDLVDSVVLYAPMSTDAATNWQMIFDSWGREQMALLAARYGGTPEDQPLAYRRVSALYYLDQAPPISIHHGTSDQVVPFAFSQHLYQVLIDKGRYAEFSPYEGVGHTFTDYNWQTFLQRSLDFFNRSFSTAR